MPALLPLCALYVLFLPMGVHLASAVLLASASLILVASASIIIPVLPVDAVRCSTSPLEQHLFGEKHRTLRPTYANHPLWAGTLPSLAKASSWFVSVRVG